MARLKTKCEFIRIITCILLLQLTAAQQSSNEIPLFPYGEKEGDIYIDDSTTPHQVNFTQSIQYYGKTYQTLYISNFGFVTFHPNQIYLPQFWRENPFLHNHPFIAPYYYNGQKKTPETSINIPGKICYRVVSKSDGVDSPLMTSLQRYMLDNVIGESVFRPDTVLVVTWENVIDVVTSQDGCVVNSNNENPCTKSDTFQLILVADRTETFAIFNYKKMETPDHHFYQAGMNGGYNNGWTDVFCGDQCGKMNLNLLPTLQGSDLVGRFIYKVSNEIIVRGGCLPSIAVSGNFEFYPQYANFYGGEIIDVSGYCVEPEEQVTCTFGAGDALTALSFPNSTKHRCEVPRLTERGVVDLVYTSRAGSLTGQFHVVLFSRSEHHLLPLMTGDSTTFWNETTPVTLGMTWKVTPLGSGEDTVDINLIGYREDADGIYWELLDVLGKDISNAQGQYSFQTADHKCQGDLCWKYEIGIVEVRLPRRFWTASNRYGSYTYGVVPLGWFVHDYMVKTHGEEYSNQNCQTWYQRDKEDMSWLDELLACPCTLDQALTDFGRWQPDIGCNIYTGSACHYHHGAVHCVRSVKPTQSGAGNQCCYRADGDLQYAADSYQGSTPDRAHDWGAPPYNKPGYVPSLSHWIDDVISFYHCCLWVEYGQCDYYMEQRPTRDCKNYNPTKSAFIYGDPHFSTFDGKSYNFAGKGEFWLVKDGQLTIQGRFDQLTTLNVTVLVGVVVQGPGGSKVEIGFNSPDSASGRTLNVRVDNKIRIFGKKFETPEWQDFNGISVIQNEYIHNHDLHNNFTIMLDSGVGVQVAAVRELLQLTVVIPDSFKGTTRGLLGNWDDDSENDFMLPAGTLMPSTSTIQDIYEQFGLAWGINKINKTSIFMFPQGYETNYQPFLTGDPPTSENTFQIKEACAGDQNCIHDYRVTGSRTVGLTTLRQGAWIKSVQNFQTKVLSCGLLHVPDGSKSNVNYSLGSEITITGCKSGSLTGDTSYTCKQNSNGNVFWDPQITASCHGGPDTGNIGMIVGIAVAAVVLVIVIIIVAVLVRRRYSSKNGHTQNDEESSRDPASGVAMVRTKKAADSAKVNRGSKTSEASM